MTQPAPAGDAAHRLHGFMQRLLAGYRRLREGGGEGLAPAELDARLDALVLGEAAMRHDCGARRPLQVAVLGPTQTGKSTVVNLLLGCRAAEVSPLAGFTVHPHGFWIGRRPESEGWAKRLLPGWALCTPAELRRDVLEAYVLAGVDCPGIGAVTGGHVVWDTPDFDSLAAQQYVRGVLEIAALADVYLLVLSKEKYSDLAVWRMLALLEPLRRPLVICVNKLTADAETAILGSVRARLAERGSGWGTVPVVALPYSPALASGTAEVVAPGQSELRRVVAAAAETTATASRRAGAVALLRRHWDDWLAPVRAEHAALEGWAELVRGAAARFMQAYERDYLDHPERYDSFRRAAIALLELLELPRVGGLIARARQIVTWPARQVLAAGRDLLQRPRPPATTLHSLGAEAGVLVDTLDVLMTGLEREVARRCATPGPARRVWLALAAALSAEEARLRSAFAQGIVAHHEHVTREVRATAGRLFAELQQSPGRLAALRTARATIDAGYLLLAVKTGGLTPLDAIWAPATFAVTSLVMESITGFEMSRAAAGLKARQRAAVEEQFVQRTLVPELTALGQRLAGEGLFQITPSELRDAHGALAEWEGGHG